VLEVSRVATDGTPHACSFLYAAAARAARAIGFDVIQTFTLESEPGASLRGAGWDDLGVVDPKNDRWHSRAKAVDPRHDGPKRKWSKSLKAYSPATTTEARAAQPAPSIPTTRSETS
jgi:hypothetical protein